MAEIVSERLSRRVPGPYAVELGFGGDEKLRDLLTSRPVAGRLNPRIESIKPITVPLIAATSRAIEDAKRYPKALGRVVSRPESWISATRAKLRLISEAVRRLAGEASPDFTDLSGESDFLWLGPAGVAPSNRADRELLMEKLGDTDDPRGRRLAAIALGRRALPLHGQPRDLKREFEAGRVLDRWPPCLVQLIGDHLPPSLIRRLDQELPEMNTPDMADALLEWWLLSDGGDVRAVVEGLSRLPPAIDEVLEDRSQVRDQLVDLLVLATELQGTRPNDGTALAAKRTLVASMADLKDLHWGELARLLGSGSPRWANALPRKTRSRLPLEECLSVLLGFDPEWDEKNGHAGASHRQIAESIVCSLTESWADDSVERQQWRPYFMTLAARAVATSGSPRASVFIADWIHHCARGLPPGKTGSDPLSVAAAALETAMAVSSWDAGSTIAGLEYFSRSGGRLLSSIRSHATEGVYGRIVATNEMVKFALRESQAAYEAGRVDRILGPHLDLVTEHHLWHVVSVIRRSNPDNLEGFLDWVSRQDREFLELPRRLVASWADLFAATDPPSCRRLVDWLCRQEDSWESRTRFLDAVLLFLECYYSDGANAELERSRFLAEHIVLLDKIARSLENIQTSEDPDQDELVRDRLDWRCEALEYLVHWWRMHDHDISEAADALLRFVEAEENLAVARSVSPLGHATRLAKLVVLLADGRPEALPVILHAMRSRRSLPIDHTDGWKSLSLAPELERFVLSNIARPRHATRIWRVTERLALAARLKLENELTSRLESWRTPRQDHAVRMPLGITGGLRDRLAELAVYSGIARGNEELPPRVRKALDLQSSFERQLERLTATPSENSHIRTRVRKLRGILDDPVTLQMRIESDLRKLVPKELTLAKLAALEALVTKVIDGHWTAVIGEKPPRAGRRDWDNALLLYTSIRSNRRLLREALRREAAGGSAAFLEWRLEHPENRRFLERTAEAGLAMNAWLEDRRIPIASPDGPLVASSSSELLEVLQMGNLFGTCLSMSGANAFATVANAVEINKKVLFVRDSRGAVVGRKLLALSETGVLYGFRSYGCSKNDSPWVKILLDLASAEIALRCGARLATRKQGRRMDAREGKPLELFAKWYYDGVEEYDWWLAERDIEGLDPTGRKSLAGRLLEPLTRYEPHNVERREQTLRGLLVLGDSLLDEDSEWGSRLVNGLTEEGAAFLKRNARPGPLKGLVHRRDAAAG